MPPASTIPTPSSLALARIDACFATGSGDAAEPLVEALHEAYPAHREVKKRVARVEVGHGRYVLGSPPVAEVTLLRSAGQRPAAASASGSTSRPIPPAAGEIRLFTRSATSGTRSLVVRFLRSQGVDRFFVVDNGSDDGSRDYLLADPTRIVPDHQFLRPVGGGSAGSTICSTATGAGPGASPWMSTRCWPTRMRSG